MLHGLVGLACTSPRVCVILILLSSALLVASQLDSWL
jgi:hypothetical protein